MYSGLIDTINSILQSIMFIVAANHCVSNEHKKGKGQIVIYILVLWIIMTLLTKLMGNSSLTIMTIHIFQLAFLMLFVYKGDKIGSLIGFSIIYIIIGINTILSFSLFMFIVDNSYISSTLANILVMYIPQFIVSYLVLSNINFIFRLNLIIKSRISSLISLILTTIVLDFMISLLFIYNNKDNPLFRQMIFILLGLFIIFIIFYFTNIDKKSNEIHTLNIELNKKINELKKIKHDYGSQISYLYGVYLMENYDKLGNLLKDIINGSSISSQIKVLTSEESLISQVVNSTNIKDVDVIIDEKADLNDVYISELDLQRIISNIVRNSIEALDGKGLLMIQSYYNFNYLVINIQNNGPKINESIIKNIFEEGFSTKENKNGDNGFGLYIVKEIIQKNNGSITVTSNESLTTFTLKLPLCIK